MGGAPQGAVHVQADQVGELRQRGVHPEQGALRLRPRTRRRDDLVHRHGRLQGRLRRAAVPAPAHHQPRALPGGAGPQRRPEAGRALGGGRRGLDARGRRPRQTIVRDGVA